MWWAIFGKKKIYLSGKQWWELEKIYHKFL